MRNKDIEECREELKQLVKKNHVFFTSRCNKSIEIAFQILNIRSKKNNFQFKNLYIQKQGGWITYANYAKKYKLQLIKLDNSKNGQIDADNDLNMVPLNEGGILIMHSMPGYSYLQDMNKIYKKIKRNKLHENVFLINDCCGSIGTNEATIGDIIVCSFGKAKPLNAGGGGFIAIDNFDNFNEEEIEILKKNEDESLAKINFKFLKKEIFDLPKKIKKWKLKKEEIENKLITEKFRILNQGQGINILVDISSSNNLSDNNSSDNNLSSSNLLNKSTIRDNEGIVLNESLINQMSEKERLIKFCKENNLEYVECPRYIRTIENAFSIEIKRLD